MYSSVKNTLVSEKPGKSQGISFFSDAWEPSIIISAVVIYLVLF